MFHLGKSVSECPRTAAFSVNGVCPYLLFLSHWLLDTFGSLQQSSPNICSLTFSFRPFFGAQSIIKRFAVPSFHVMILLVETSFRCLGDFHSPQEGFVIVCSSREHLHRPRYAFSVAEDLVEVFSAWFYILLYLALTIHNISRVIWAKCDFTLT